MDKLIRHLITGALLCLLAGCQGDRPQQRVDKIEPAASSEVDARPVLAPFDAKAAGLSKGDLVEIEAYPPYTEDNPGEQCAVLEANIARAGDAILAMAPPSADLGSKPVAGAALYEGLIKTRFGISRDEKALLKSQGFYAADDWRQDNYGRVLHEIYRSELPIYLSLDAILHPIYVSHDRLMGAVERGRLAPMLRAIVDRLHEALPVLASGYPDEVVGDLDLYLTVARRLLHDDAGIAGHFGSSSGAGLFVEAAMEATRFGDFAIFGRDRKIDFTAYQPRGRYKKFEDLGPYFRGAMWLSRLEFNVVSRSCRSSHPAQMECDSSETPREALAALALADLVHRAGVGTYLAQIDGAWAMMAGAREDISMGDLQALHEAAGIEDLRAPGAFVALKGAIGERFKRSARLHYMPGSVGELPAISTLLGPRVVSDTKAIMRLSEPEVGGRYSIKTGDIGFVLGHDKALDYFGGDLGRFADLRGKLDQARRELQSAPVGDDFYSLWMGAVSRIGALPKGVTPSFMGTPGYRDMRLNTAIVAYGQLRHNNVLVAGEPYGVGGCQMPDAYVEPAPEVYDALIAYARRGASFFAEADPADELGARRYFAQTAFVLRVLRRMQDFELAGRPLPPEALTFMNTIVEILPASSSGGPQYNGWYFDLFYAEGDDPVFYEADSHPGLEKAAFIASTFTSPEDDLVSYVGASGVHRGVFRVDVGGKRPRLMVGPVAQGFERARRLGGKKRLDDEDALPFDTHAQGGFDQPSAPWARSYTVKKAAEPPLALVVASGWDENAAMIWLKGKKRLSGLRVVVLDHHRRPVLTRRVNVGSEKWTTLAIKTPRGMEDNGSLWMTGVQIHHGGAVHNIIFGEEMEMESYLSLGMGGMEAYEGGDDPTEVREEGEE